MKKTLNKEKIINIAFLTVVLLVFCFSLFSSEMHVSHDSYFHMNRLVGLVDAFRDHQFLPKVYPYTNNGYGYATPLFYCDLFLYPFAILYWLGVPLVICYKLMIAFYSFLGIFIVFIVGKKIFKGNKLTPYFLTIIYTFSNYRLYDVYARGSLGEIFAFAFVPLIFYSIYKIFFLKQDSWIMLGISFALLLLSHNISFALYCALFFLFIVLYIFVNRKDLEDLKCRAITTIKAVIIAILLSSWYLFPMFEQFMDQTFIVNHLSTMYDLENSIMPLSTILRPFANMDTKEIHIFTLINIGWPLLFLPMLYAFVPKKEKNIYVSASVIAMYVVILFTTGFFIQLTKIFGFVQFMFRFYIIVYPVLSFASSYVFDKINLSQKMRYSLLIVLIIYSTFNSCLIQIEALNDGKSYSLNIKNNITKEEMYDDFSEERKLHDYNALEISGAEYLPTTEIVDYLDETTFIKEITSDGYLDYIYDFERNFTKIWFNVESPSRKLIMLPQTYYKGYQAYKVVDGEKIEIEAINVPNYKKVGFYIDEGYGEYYCEYKGTTVQNISLATSTVSLIYVICAIIKGSKNRKLI